MASLEDNNLLVFYYLSASVIRPDKRGGGLWWEWPYKRGTYCIRDSMFSTYLYKFAKLVFKFVISYMEVAL
jgi:hypothetical protein